MFTSDIKMGKDSDICDFTCSMVLSNRWDGSSISETSDLLGIPTQDTTEVYTE